MREPVQTAASAMERSSGSNGEQQQAIAAGEPLAAEQQQQPSSPSLLPLSASPPALAAAAASSSSSVPSSAPAGISAASSILATAPASAPLRNGSLPPSERSDALPPAAPASPPARLQYLEALADASNAINATLELEKVAEVLVARTAALLDVPGVSVMLVEGGNVRIAAAKGLSPEYVEAQNRPLEQSIAGRALAEERTFAAWDVRQVPDPRVAEAALREGITSVACAPMFFAGKPVGALNLYCRSPRCFTDDQFHTLSLLAAQGAVAISNARAYRELRAQAAELRASFQRIGSALASSLDLGETLRLIVELASEMTDAEGGAMFMLQDEREGGGMLLSASRGLDRRCIRRFRRMEQPSPLIQRAIRDRRGVIVSDTRRQPDTPFPKLRPPGDEQEEIEARSVVCVPVLAGSRPVAVLEQYSSVTGSFDRTDLQLLTSFASQAAVAIENARLYAQERGISQTLQRAFLPELPGAISGFQIGRIYSPGSEIASVGGDTYDLFTLPDGRIAAVIADVCGQGTVAATLTVMAKYTIRAYALEDPAPSRVLTRVNEALMHQTGDSTFLTICYALIDPATRHVQASTAAHPPALFCRPSENICRALCDEPGLIVGFLPDQQYKTSEQTFQPGDVIVFYTDGVTEARRRKVTFDVERLQTVIAGVAHLSAQEIAAAIYSAVADYASGSLTDDIALLVLKAE